MRPRLTLAALALALACALDVSCAAREGSLRAAGARALGAALEPSEASDTSDLSPEEQEAVDWGIAAEEMRQMKETEASGAAARANPRAEVYARVRKEAGKLMSQCLAPLLPEEEAEAVEEETEKEKVEGKEAEEGEAEGEEVVDPEEGAAEAAAPAVTGRYAAYADKQQFVCVLSGAARVAKGEADKRGLRDLEFEVPPECRPSHHMVFPASSSLHRHHHVVLYPDGKVAWRDGAERYDRVQLEGAAEERRGAETVSLAGMLVPLVKEVPLDLQEGWSTYRADGADVFGRFGFIIHRGLCHLTGSVAYTGRPVAATHRVRIAKLPATCTPPTMVQFVAAAGEVGTVRLLVTPDGFLAFSDFNRKLDKAGWVSLAGVSFPQTTPPRRAKESPLMLGEHWQFSTSAPDGPLYWTNGNICFVHGLVARLIHREHKMPLITTLPEGCRPACPVFATDPANKEVVAMPNGEVRQIYGIQSGPVVLQFMFNTTTEAARVPWPQPLPSA